MNTSKLTYLMVIGLALTFSATGCKKNVTGITKLPTGISGNPKDGGPAVPDGGRIPGGETPIGGGPLSTIDPEQFNQDRTTYAAHIVHFDFDSSTVKPSERSHVVAVAAGMKGNSNPLLIEGHCDERGTEEYNRSLGERRALALREELAKLGADPSRIVTRSFGEDKPVAQGHDESAYKQNRRGEFIVLLPK